MMIYLLAEAVDQGKAAQGFLILGVAFFLYFLPAMVALTRRHTNAAAIVVLDIFLGWTFVGWVVALVWAFMVKEVRK